MDTPNSSRVPGLKYRTVTRTITVPETVDGVTYDVPREIEEHVPVLPTDWQLVVLRVVFVATALVLAGSLAWTTVSIGALLSLAVVAGIAYAAAAVFDVTWIVCMAAEWLARYDPDRARLARLGGWVALAVSVAAVTVHGAVVAGSWSVGVIGAFVQILAKGLATIVMRHATYPMGEAKRAWLSAHRQEVGTRLAVMLEMRELDRAEAWISAHRAARTLSGHTADNPGQPPALPVSAVPDADVAASAEYLKRAGHDIDEDTVRANLGPHRTTPDSSSADVLPLDPDEAASIADIVKLCLDDGITDNLRVLSVARQVLGPDVRADSVARTMRRYAKKSRTA